MALGDIITLYQLLIVKMIWSTRYIIYMHFHNRTLQIVLFSHNWVRCTYMINVNVDVV